MTPRVDPGRKGGVYPVPPAPVPLPLSIRLIEKAKANGWEVQDSDEFTKDGTRLVVHLADGSLSRGVLFPPNLPGVFVTAQEVHGILDNELTCVCTEVLGWPLNRIKPDPKCRIKHDTERINAQCFEVLNG